MNYTATATNTACLIVATVNGKCLFRFADLIRLEASSNYTVIHSRTQRPLVVAKVLGDYEVELAQAGFIRTHRSHLINRQYVRALDRSGNLVLADESLVEVSRRRKKEVYASLVQP